MKNFQQFRESLNEAKKDEYGAEKYKEMKKTSKVKVAPAAEKTFEKILSAASSLNSRGFPPNNGMRDFVEKVFKKAGIKKPSDLGKVVSAFGFNDSIRGIKKTLNDVPSAYGQFGKEPLPYFMGQYMGVVDGAAEFLACIAAAYENDSLTDWDVKGIS